MNTMVKVTFPESTVPEASVSSSTATKNPKIIHTNQPYALCDLHGHYSHHFPRLTHYRASLEVVWEYEIKQNQSASPILVQYAVGQIEDLPAPIDIPPLDVEMMEPAATILYLSSSMRPLVEAPSESSPIFLLDLPSAITLGSTSVDPLSACSSIIPYDDAHVNLSSHDDESGSFIASCALPSSHHSILYCDDDIMEALSTPNLIFLTHKRDGTIRVYGDFRGLSTSC